MHWHVRTKVTGDDFCGCCETYPKVVQGVAGVARVVDEAVAAIVPLRQRHAKLGVDVLHELAPVVDRLAKKRKEDWQRKYKTFVLVYAQQL